MSQVVYTIEDIVRLEAACDSLHLELSRAEARVKELEEERDRAQAALVEVANEENAQYQGTSDFDRGGERVRAAIARVRALRGEEEKS